MNPTWYAVPRAVKRAAVRTIMQTHNRRLYRVARSIVRDGAEAEDVLQEAYLHAFQSLSRFRGEASLATWLTRIVLNEALQRVRRHTDCPSRTLSSQSNRRATSFLSQSTALP